MKRSIALAVVLLFASLARADQLATVVALSGTIEDFTPLTRLEIKQGVYPGAPIFSLDSSAIGVAVDWPVDLWSFNGFASGGGVTVNTVTAYNGQTPVFVRLDQAPGNYHFAREFGPGATQSLIADVTRLVVLPPYLEFPSPYSSATWTLDAVDAQAIDDYPGYAVTFAVTGHYYLAAPEPSSNVLLLVANGFLFGRRRYLPRFLM